MNFLENKYMRLRAPEPEDLDLLYRWENNTSVWTAGITLTPYSRDILKKYLATAHQDIFENKQLRLMIDIRKGKRYKTIGTIDLFDFDPHNQRAGVGILIADVSERKKGYASMAVNMMIKYCFSVMGIHQLYCNIEAGNTISIKLFEKAGFKKTGVKKEWLRRGNKWTDELMYQLINPE